ncbi:MAG: twin-arginine translocase TatA/TatE family subunit [Methylobacteriaceae bacterium]|nr:twin-arginine translocase TatA/TatE family subunit [Methylobacteriaceae bacterium]MBV9221188.1 twin-arginine translocase TatA/TatE family subunit [Methylobacteriaceae bacterium]MBV9244036.1 twin-arginine translocase TatA/TatE family subunit [Methylobacteriaceae bacterium]MBV9637491.1 twin-arginine translocase TatA/TatE family subunit [Methylobacteriaceae bacterium]MBV9701401.1 twin-arginine translocase TatA/TatE family subunit [Methylobacteriaceae bacterium]
MFGARSLVHWIILGIVVLLLFGGRNKISDLMSDLAKGIKSFKKGMNEDSAETPPAASEPPKAIDHQPAAANKSLETPRVG